MDKRKGQPKEEQTTQWTKEKDNRRRNIQHNGQKKRTTEGGTYNTMDKRKGQPKEEQTTQWTKERDNRRRNIQHNGQKKRTTEVPQKTT
jgi:hypothetical protein